MDRFMCYIAGGQPMGASKSLLGCQDKTPPIDNEEIYISSEIYFAKSSKSWNKQGVAFLKNKFSPKHQTFGRMYLITKDQFIQIVEQETNRNCVTIDFQKAIDEKTFVFIEKSWYGRIIHIGTQYGYPIFTFTSEEDFESSKPSESYLKTIAEGIKQVYSLNDLEITNYLITKEGIANNYSNEELLSALS